MTERVIPASGGVNLEKALANAVAQLSLSRQGGLKTDCMKAEVKKQLEH
jgi:hypothetical protein